MGDKSFAKVRHDLKPFSKRLWVSVRQTRRSYFQRIVEDPKHQNLFNDEFFRDLIDRKKERERLEWKIWIVQTTLFGFLALTIFPAHTESLREAILFGIASLGLAICVLRMEVGDLEGMLDVLAIRRAGPEAVEYLRVFYSPQVGRFPKLRAPTEPYVYPGLVVKILGITLIALIVMIAGAIVMVTAVIMIAVVIDVVRQPSLPWIWSYLIAGYSAFCYLFTLLMTGLDRLSLPFRDYRLVGELSKLKETNPTEWRRRVDEVLARKKSRWSLSKKGGAR